MPANSSHLPTVFFLHNRKIKEEIKKAIENAINIYCICVFIRTSYSVLRAMTGSCLEAYMDGMSPEATLRTTDKQIIMIIVNGYKIAI